jgi:hypothetical protein
LCSSIFFFVNFLAIARFIMSMSAIGQSNHSLREERELNIIKSGLQHDKESKQWSTCPMNEADELNTILTGVEFDSGFNTSWCGMY